jgi:hypothetical protein
MIRQLVTFLLLAPGAVIAFVPARKMTGQKFTVLDALKKNVPALSQMQDLELTRSVIMQSYYNTLNDQELTMEVIRARFREEGTLLEVENEANMTVAELNPKYRTTLELGSKRFMEIGFGHADDRGQISMQNQADEHRELSDRGQILMQNEASEH